MSAWILERVCNGVPPRTYLRQLITPFNLAAGLIVLLGCPFLVWRYLQGLGVVTHASNDQPWGLFLAWGLFSGVPLASTGFLLASAVYLFGMKHYYPLLRPAVLTGFIGYFFAVVYLLVDLGMPWRLPYPMIRSFGTGSVMFLVAWHVALYLSTQFVEFCPAIFEWLGADRFRRWALRVTIGATIFGVILSTLHQSALGALFLLAPGKLHPLWYSPYLPLLFFISSIFAGLSMVIVESALVSRYLPQRVGLKSLQSLDPLTLGLGKGAALALVTYFAMKWIALAHGHHWALLNTGYGWWFLVEVFGFVLVPSFLFLAGVRKENARLVRWTAVFTIVGVIANRFTVSMFAFNWKLPHREFFYWKELIIVASIVAIEVLTYRWIVNRLPVHKEHPRYPGAH
ncbi:MAG: polysulfide reductase NrfD [Verrucomicrobia bacterium]|nr:polysulfide reductase NrfD [Verrucomicrobiota bacterium]